MKKLLNLTTLLFVLTLNTGCSFSPSSFYGSTTKPEKTNQVIDDIQFKRSLMRLMSRKDQAYLQEKIKTGVYGNQRFEDINRSNGSDALMVAAVGGNPTSGGGAAATLGLGLAASYIQGLGERDNTSGIVVSQEWLGSDTDSIEDVQLIIANKTVELITNTAKAFNYQVECTYNCDKRLKTLELTRLIDKTHEDQYFPYKLIVNIYARDFKLIKDDDVLSKTFGDESKFYGDLVVYISEPRKLIDNKVNYSEHEFEGVTWYQGLNQKNIIDNKLGRDMYRHFSAQLPTWYFGGEFFYNTSDYAVNNGNIYMLENQTKHDEMRGILAIDK